MASRYHLVVSVLIICSSQKELEARTSPVPNRLGVEEHYASADFSHLPPLAAACPAVVEEAGKEGRRATLPWVF